VKADWDAWNVRSLADEPIVRLILDGTVVEVRLDRKATAISLLVVIGMRADGQKVLPQCSIGRCLLPVRSA
jgi:putative transposase